MNCVYIHYIVQYVMGYIFCVVWCSAGLEKVCVCIL